ncbi:MAG: 23S rRNA (uridine(2552)-2'-O)-methyltransferase RlmE [Gammaproteobacteria bacterium]|nr:23S rRNA (uridine(2552)-2'-O)-methyltransferase RlmE [Gammaproteobacteria bacterium]
MASTDKKNRSNRRWLDEHFNDPYVQLAQQKGYRSRASFKLLEIHEKDHLIRQGMTVLDLGAAPGGWSQIASNLVGRHGRVIATDILEMAPLEGVEFIHGDFREQQIYDRIVAALPGGHADLVISDMAPNISGMGIVDQPRAMYLVELALDMARNVLGPEGAMLVKVFQGSGSEEFLKAMRASFNKVVIRKPKASRPRSREVYMLGRNIL